MLLHTNFATKVTMKVAINVAMEWMMIQIRHNICSKKTFSKIHCSDIFEKVATISHADTKILNAKRSQRWQV